MQPFHDILALQVTAAFQKLFNTKHLYQCVDLDLSSINKETATKEIQKIHRPPFSTTNQNTPKPTVEMMLELGKKCAANLWVPALNQGDNQRYGPAPMTTLKEGSCIHFKIPSVKTFCAKCDGAWPFNLANDAWCAAAGSDQWFVMSFQCQNCKESLVWFLVRRRGLKLILAGRDPIEILPVPKELPKAASTHYSSAQIAHHAGQTLAGIFLLRTFIEQFWKSCTEVQKLIVKQPKPTGDEMGDIYLATLPDDFKKRFPSLKEIYSDLSAAMHEARDDAQLFQDSSAKIIKHFEARKLFGLVA